jgi:hypothetical protein
MLLVCVFLFIYILMCCKSCLRRQTIREEVLSAICYHTHHIHPVIMVYIYTEYIVYYQQRILYANVMPATLCIIHILCLLVVAVLSLHKVTLAVVNTSCYKICVSAYSVLHNSQPLLHVPSSCGTIACYTPANIHAVCSMHELLQLTLHNLFIM